MITGSRDQRAGYLIEFHCRPEKWIRNASPDDPGDAKADNEDRQTQPQSVALTGRASLFYLAAKAEDLRSRGTPFAERVTGFERPPRVLRVDPSATPGCLFEFAEFEDSRTE